MAGKSKIDDFLVLLREAIIAGTWSIGEKLPPEEYFMETFQVSRTLLREAMKLLIAEGIIMRKHGSGTYLQSVPRKRIELYVRLENIISIGANWFRWQIEYMKKACRSMDYDLEVLVSHGDTPGLEAASFSRHLNCPLTSDIVASLVLFYSPELEERLRMRGGHFVTLTTVYGADFADSAVVLDYEEMGRMMKNAVARHNPSKPCLVCIDDKEENIGKLTYSQMHILYDTVMPDKSCQLAVSSYEAMEEVFGKWLAENGDDCDMLVFADDEVAKLAFNIMSRSGKKFPGITCITHGNSGLFDMHMPETGALEIVSFDLERVASAVWRLLNNTERHELIKIQPEILFGVAGGR